MKKIRFCVEGFNFFKFLNLLKKNNIEVFDFFRKDEKTFEVIILKKDKKTFLKLVKKNNMKILFDASGNFFMKFYNFLKKNIAYVCCSIVLLSSIFFANNFVFQIEIYGLNDLQEKEIVQVLKENNYNVGKNKSSYDLGNMEILLKNKFDKISLVSSTIVGNTILINIKEKEKIEEISKEPLLAPFNLTVKKVSLLSGTLNVSEGQIVKQGEILVSPYIDYKDGTQLNVEAKATIECYAEKTYTQLYFENHEEFVRTGNVKIEKKVSLFKSKDEIINNSKVNCFDNYEIETSENFLFKNFFLPIKQTTIKYYETKKQMVYKPFDETMQQKMIEENEKLLYNTFDNCLEVEDKDFSSQVIKVENYYLISTTISALVKF